MNVTNSTFSGNTALGSGSGIFVNDGTLNLYNTILANSPAGSDCYSSDSVNGSHNLIETDGAGGHACGTTGAINGSDPNLGALAYNGGPTQTFAIPTTSPAYNAGDNTICAAAPVSNKDQRGMTPPKTPPAILARLNRTPKQLPSLQSTRTRIQPMAFVMRLSPL